jgi:adenylate cyclase
VSLFAELKRRNVFRVGLFYVVTAWLVIEVAETVLPLFDVPDGVLRGLVVLLVIGLVPALGLSWIYELTPDGIKRDAGPSTADAQSSATGRKLNWATLIVAALAIGLLVSDRLLREPPSTDTAVAQQAGHPDPEAGAIAQADTQANAGPVIPDASIAVLPFADLSPEGDQQYFSDGIAEEILNVLSRIEALSVTSRTSAFAFKSQSELSIPDIAASLGVRHVLEGSVRKAADTIRVTAQLIDARSDQRIWSETFERQLTAQNVFAIQDEIAAAITAALVRFEARVRSEYPDSPGAQDTYTITAWRLAFRAYDRVPEGAVPGWWWAVGYPGLAESPHRREAMIRARLPEYWRAHGFPPQCRPVGADAFACD